VYRQTVAGELEQPGRGLRERRAGRGRGLRPHPAGEGVAAGWQRSLKPPVGPPAADAVSTAELPDERCARERKVELLREGCPRSHRAASVAACQVAETAAGRSTLARSAAPATAAEQKTASTNRSLASPLHSGVCPYRPKMV